MVHIHWFGPKTVHFSIPTAGNPYNPILNNVQVEWVGPHGVKAVRLAYWTGTDWACTVLVNTPGTYRGLVERNGKFVAKLPQAVRLAVEQKMPMVQIGPESNRFETEDGKPFWPMGHDLGWHNTTDKYSLTGYLRVMGENGINWARIWATFWDGRNPWWSAPKIGELDQKALLKWDAIVKAGERNGVYIQWTLFHHGLVSSTTDPNWQQNPWNVKNGGWLNSAEDFFTDPKAIRLCKAYLRYIVARYSAYPDIFGWEIFNEVQWSDAAHNNHWSKIAKWHKIMADYIRSIDPYHHPITSSSDLPAVVNAPLDYLNDHGYPASVWTMLLAHPAKTKRPLFYAEVGPNSGTDDESTDRKAVRDGIWGGIIANDAASGKFWYWDRVAQFDLYPEYRLAHQILLRSKMLSHPDRKTLQIQIHCQSGADLTFSPGQGWSNGSKLSFDLPSDSIDGKVGAICSYFQGNAHNQQMQTGPLHFHFDASRSGTFQVDLGKPSASGGALQISLNGQLIYSHDFPNGSQGGVASVPFSRGENEVTVSNDGSDWVTITKFAISGIGPSVSGAAIGDSSWMLGRFFGKPGATFGLSRLSLDAGEYQATWTNLDSGEEGHGRVHVANGTVHGLELHGKDDIIYFQRV